MPTVGFVKCPHCVEEYILPGWPPRPKPTQLAKVYVKCSGCDNTLELRVVEIDVAYHSLQGKPHAAVIRIEPPSPNNETKFYDDPPGPRTSNSCQIPSRARTTGSGLD